MQQLNLKFIVPLLSSIVFEYGLCWGNEVVAGCNEPQETDRELCSLYDGPIGICKSIKFCQTAIEEMLKHPIFLETCGWNEYNENVVCCADNLVLTSLTRVPVTERLVPSTPTTKIQKVGDKSRQQCKEYSKHFQLIFGGKSAEPREFPHMALIGFEDKDNYNEIQYLCGGSLISEKFVLSAAHCTFHGTYGRPKYILLGELVLDLDTDDADPQRILIKNIFPHPKYQYPSHYHDIALFELDRQAKIDRIYIKPACLNTNPSLKDKHAIATGWGTTAFSEMSKELQKVTLDIFTTSECNYTYRGNIGLSLEYGIVDEIQMCAGSRRQSKDACQGDSGGPLQIKNTQYSDAYNIIGITSFGKGCGAPRIPGVYTKVSAYIQWIEDIVWP